MFRTSRFPATTSTSIRRDRPGSLLCGVMAFVVIAASWSVGGVSSARNVRGLPTPGNNGPVVPQEENETESSAHLAIESLLRSRRRHEAVGHAPSSLTEPIRPQSADRACRRLLMSCCFDGHRLANGLLAPLRR